MKDTRQTMRASGEKRIRLGFIGFGKHARRVYWPWLQKTALAEVTSISCDLDLHQKKVKEFEGVPFVFDYESMLRDFPLDAVVVTTPHALHFEQAKLSLSHGLHVLVDKPLTCSLSQANDLIKLAHDKGKRLAVGVERRYEKVYKLAKKTIEEGKIGEIRCVDCSFARAVDPGFETTWRNDPLLSGGGVLIDSGHHVIDAVMWITGLSVESCQGYMICDNYKVEKSCTISAAFNNGATGSFAFTYTSPLKLRQEQIWLYGSEGTLSIVSYRPDGGRRSPALTMQTKFTDSPLNLLENKDLESFPEAPLRNLIESVLFKSPLIAEAASTLSALRFVTDLYRNVKTITV